MSKTPSPPAPSALNLGDMIYVLFKYKWIIALAGILSVGAAYAYYKLAPVSYASEARLMVRYITEVNLEEQVNRVVPTPGDRTSEAAIKSEVAILTSWDLAETVASAMEAERVSTGSSAQPVTATQIEDGLTVTPEKGTNVITVVFKHRDRAQARAVLQRLVAAYQSKHREIHRPGASSREVRERMKGLQTSLLKIEEKLRNLKMGKESDENGNDPNATSTALPGSLKEIGQKPDASKQKDLDPLATGDTQFMTLAEITAKLNADILNKQSESEEASVQLAEQLARMKQIPGIVISSSGELVPAAGEEPDANKGKSPSAGAPVTDSRLVEEYRLCLSELTTLRAELTRLSEKFKPASSEYKQKESQIARKETRRRELEREHPDLLATAPITSNTSDHTFDPVAEKAKYAAAVTKDQLLKQALQNARKRLAAFSGYAPAIAELERRKATEEVNYKYMATSLDKTETDLDLEKAPGQMASIPVVQSSTPAAMDVKKRNLVVLGIAFGGPLLAVIFVLIFAALLNQTVKRSPELEATMPFMLSIPYFSSGQRLAAGQAVKALKGGAGEKKGAHYQFLRPFTDAIRDRLTAYFHSRGITRNPKMIAVTGYATGAGVSTLAAGLAASLSETHEGKVLLVDMNGDQGTAHPFLNGQPAPSLTEALSLSAEAGRNGQNGEGGQNLFLAGGETPSSGVSAAGLRRLMPELKTSDFEYVIFDMPPLGQTRPTASVAGLMDKVIVIVEAGANTRAEIRRGHRDLVDAGADISVVFNKAKAHGPKALMGS